MDRAETENYNNVEYFINRLLTDMFEREEAERIRPESLLGKKIIKNLPNGSIIEFLEKELKPEYENSVFTWANIKTALKKDNGTLRQF